MANIETDLIIEAITKGFDKAAANMEKLGKSGESVEKGTEKASKSIGAFDVALGNLAAGALQKVGELLVDFVAGSIEVASSAAETASLLENSLGPAAEGFSQQIQQMADATNRSAIELEAGASTIVAMTRSMGFGQQAAADYSASMAQIATDLGSFFNQSTEQVFQDLQGALAGSSETLQKYGIDVRETQLKNIALEQGLISQGETLDRVTRAQLIQSEVLRQAADAMGDAERTSDSYQNTQRGLEAAVLDLQAALGEALIPAMTELLTAATAVTERLQTVAKTTGEYGDQVESTVESNIKAAQSMEELIDTGQGLDEAFNVFLGLGPAITGTEEQIRQGIVDLAGEMAAAAGSFDGFKAGMEQAFNTRAMNAFEAELRKLGLTQEQFFRIQSKVNEPTVDFIQNLDDLRAMGADATTSMEEFVEVSEDTERNLRAMSEEAENASTTFDRLEIALGGTSEAMAYMALVAKDAGQAVDDYEVSAEDVARAEEDRAAAHDEAAEAAQEAADAAAELQSRLGDYFTDALPAVEATGSLEEQLMAAADAAGAGAGVMAALATATGNYAPEAIEAALQQAAFNEAVAQMGAAVASGQIGVPEAIAALQDLKAELSNPPPPLIIETNIEEATAGLSEADAKLAEKLGVFTAESQGLAQGAQTAFGDIANAATSNMPTVEEAITTATANAAASAETNMAAVQTAVDTNLAAAVTVAQGYVGHFEGIGTSMWQGMVAGVNAGQGPLSAAVAGIVAAAIQAGKDEAGAASPAKVPQEEIGLPISQGIAKGIEEGEGVVNDAIEYVLDSSFDRMGNKIAAGIPLLEAMFNQGQGVLKSKLNLAQFKSLFGGVQGGVTAANGASGIVPPGHPSDTFPIWAKSGEQYAVAPPGQSLNSGPLVGTLIVNGTPGMNENMLADKTSRRIAALARQRRNSRATGARY